MEPFDHKRTRDLSADIDVVGQNIHTTHHRFGLTSECTLLHTEELYELLAPEIANADEGDLFSLFPDDIRDKNDLPFSPAESHRAPLQMLYRSLHTAERVALCRAITTSEHLPRDLSTLVERLYGTQEPAPIASRGLVAYQQNIFTDEAYLHFSHWISRPRATYNNSFSGVCEQVYNGLCEYCILPLENSQDGKLLRFYGMIEKYELKIVLTCDVTASDKQQTTTFGLCARDLSFLSPLLYGQERSETRFEFIFRQNNDELTVGDILNAAQACSLRLIRADCLPRSDEEIMVGAGFPYILSFDLEGSDFHTFLLFLSMDSAPCLPLGIYRHL